MMSMNWFPIAMRFNPLDGSQTPRREMLRSITTSVRRELGQSESQSIGHWCNTSVAHPFSSGENDVPDTPRIRLGDLFDVETLDGMTWVYETPAGLYEESVKYERRDIELPQQPD
jgi:hypothetical protein